MTAANFSAEEVIALKALTASAGESHLVSAGENLIFSLNVLSGVYANRFNNLNFHDDFVYLREGDLNKILVSYYPIESYFTQTFFSIKKNVLFRSERALTNMLATARMFSVGQSRGITFLDFVTRANKYFNLGLTIPSSELESHNPLIASIEVEEGIVTHTLCHLFRSDKNCYSKELVSIYTVLLNKILDIENDKKTKVNAIFCLVFLFGSNPILHRGIGGAFLTDTLMLLLLHQIGEKPIRKNFLNLTEIELLLCFSNDDSASWEKPYQLYEAACGGETNALFHPIEAGMVPLLATLPTAESVASCWQNYDEWRLVLFFKIAISIEETDISFQKLTDVPVDAIMKCVDHFPLDDHQLKRFLLEKETVSLRELIHFVRENELGSGVTFADFEKCWMTLAKGEVYVEGVDNAFLSSVLQLYQNRIKDSVLLKGQLSQKNPHQFFSAAAAASAVDGENIPKPLKKE